MPTYRLRLELTGPFGTPFNSGTLFGHLCWAYRRRFGEPALADRLARLPQAPWVVSDAFPADYLPRPALRPPPLPENLPAKELDEAKDRSKNAPGCRLRAGASSAATWPRRRCRAPPPRPPSPNGHGWPTTPSIGAAGTRRKPPGSGLPIEYWPKAGTKLDVYLEVPADHADPAFLRNLFEEVGREGFGRDANLGRGQFVVADITEDLSWLVERPDAPGTLWRMSLSHGVPTPNMQRPRYKLAGHFGKLGDGAMGPGVRPWKRPLLLTRPGAVFQPADAGPFGRWIRGVHQDRQEVGHNGFHFTTPFILAEGAL